MSSMKRHGLDTNLAADSSDGWTTAGEDILAPGAHLGTGGTMDGDTFCSKVFQSREETPAIPEE